MDAAAGRLKVLWEHSVVGFEKAPGDGVMTVELPEGQGSCLLCTQPGKQEACSASAVGTTSCKEVLKGGLSKSGFPWSWDGVKCTSCKAALVTVAGGAQVILDASGEGEAQAVTLLSTAAVLKAAAAASGKSLGEAALRNRVAMGALTSLAVVMSVALNKVGVLPMSPDEAQPCFVDWMLDNLEMVFLTAGQGVLPGLAALVADWKCCSSDRYRKNCGRNRRDDDPEPPRTTTPEPSQIVQRLSEAVEAGEAMAQNTLKELANFRATRAFAAAGAFASPDWKQLDRVHWKEITDQKFGAFCAKDAAPKVANTAQQKRTQQENELDWQVCWCAQFCQTWLASSTPPGSARACYETLQGSNERIVCSGAWWEELRKQQGQPVEKTYEPLMYKAPPYGGFKIQAPPGVKILLSFGGRTKNFYDQPSASDIGLERARRLKALLTQKYDPSLNPNFVYIDADALDDMDGKYTNANGRTLNVYWEQYYKDAMHNARLIIFLVDKAWLLSRNCFEELAWAQGKQLCTKHNEWPYRLDMCDYEEREFESKPFVDAPAPLRIVAFLGQEALEHRGGAGKTCPQHSLQGYGDTSGQCMSMAGFEEMPCDELTHDYDIQLQNVMDLVAAREAEWNSRRLTTII